MADKEKKAKDMFKRDLAAVFGKYVAESSPNNMDLRWKEFELSKFQRPTHSKHYGERPSYLAWRQWKIKSAEDAQKELEEREREKREIQLEAHKKRLQELKAYKGQLEGKGKGKGAASSTQAPVAEVDTAEAAKRIDNAIWRAWYRQRNQRLAEKGGQAPDLRKDSALSQSLLESGDYDTLLSPGKLDELIMEDMEDIQMDMFSSVPELELFIEQVSRDMNFENLGAVANATGSSATEIKPEPAGAEIGTAVKMEDVQEMTGIVDSQASSATGSVQGDTSDGGAGSSTGTGDSKRKVIDKNSEDYKKQRREAHILAEKKRRNNIKNGLDDLQQILPNCQKKFAAQTFSKATILQKAIDYIQHLTRTRSSSEENLYALRREAMALKLLQLKLAEAQAARQNQNMLGLGGNMGENKATIQRSLPEMIKFIIFRHIVDKLFHTFNDIISLQSFESLCSSVFTWLEQYSRPANLRDIALESLRSIGEKYFVADQSRTMANDMHGGANASAPQTGSGADNAGSQNSIASPSNITHHLQMHQPHNNHHQQQQQINGNNGSEISRRQSLPTTNVGPAHNIWAPPNFGI
eukprot:Nk52_evm6s273 gene=Nk52_evmTU6s273